MKSEYAREICGALISKDDVRWAKLPMLVTEKADTQRLSDIMREQSKLGEAASALVVICRDVLPFSKYCKLVSNDCLYDALQIAKIDPACFAFSVYGYMLSCNEAVYSTAVVEKLRDWDAEMFTDESQEIFNVVMRHLIDFLEKEYG